ncbi:MAG: GNAT family N-acetyltransferase [Armatimonadetes bacterium]|nr:GNAT family N-acetyltransferase [Armatimonadota bacterium]
MSSTFDLQPRISALKRMRAEVIAESDTQRIIDLGGPWAIVEPLSDGWFPSQNLNRVIDLHCAEGDFESLPERMIEVYEGTPRHFVYLDPSASSADLFRILSEAGYRVCNEMSVLARVLSEVNREPGPFTLREATPDLVEDLESVLSYHGTQEQMWRSPTVGLVGQPGSVVLLAYDGAIPVAVGTVTAHEGIAYLSSATTVPEWRERGAQRQLIDARVAWAADQGCDHAFSETYRFLKSSYSNLVACGFREIYQRWICRYESDPEVRAGLIHTLDGHQPAPR